jgi:hypothetical protein
MEHAPKRGEIPVDGRNLQGLPIAPFLPLGLTMHDEALDGIMSDLVQRQVGQLRVLFRVLSVSPCKRKVG